MEVDEGEEMPDQAEMRKSHEKQNMETDEESR